MAKPLPQTRYGLKLNRDLLFEGKVSPANALTLGAYLIEGIQRQENIAMRGFKLFNLEGHLFGADAKSKSYPDKYRTLTATPALGHLLLTAFEEHKAAINRLSDKPEVFAIRGMGILHIPKLEVASRYRPLFPDGEYLTQPEGDIDDLFHISLNTGGQLDFSITVNPPTFHGETEI